MNTAEFKKGDIVYISDIPESEIEPFLNKAIGVKPGNQYQVEGIKSKYLILCTKNGVLFRMLKDNVEAIQ